MAVYLSLGSNIGDRAENLRRAVAALGDTGGVTLLTQSKVYETAPVGDTEQSPFLNLAVAIETKLTPPGLLDRTQEIEREEGRLPTRRWGPRVIDIDIVLWDGLVLREDRLTIPHPEYRSRAFVLVPLAEIAPDAVDPVTGDRVADIAAHFRDQPGVRPHDV